MRLFRVISAALLMSACQPSVDSSVRRVEALSAARTVNATWAVDCTRDQVTNERRCFAGTFGTRSAPFQVYYIDGRGPFVLAGWHTFPGRKPQIRFDNDASPFTVADDAGVTPNQPQMSIVNRLRSASTAYVRYHSWPYGSREMTVDVGGFPDAWEKLRRYLSGEVAPAESGRFPL